MFTLSRGAVRCDICELSFAHQLLLDIHKRGRLHKEMEAKLETEHDKVPNINKFLDSKLFWYAMVASIF